MVLTPEQIDAEAFARGGDMKGAPLALCRGFACAIEAEVRKQDTELIRQMLATLEDCAEHTAICKNHWYSGCDCNKAVVTTAAKARLGETT